MVYLKPKTDLRFGLDVRTGMFTMRSRGFDQTAIAFGTHLPGGQSRATGAVKRVQRWQPYLLRVRNDYIRITERNFKVRGRLLKWQPLSANTVAAKRKFGYPRRIMVRTGALLRSLTDPRDPNFYQKLTANSASWGSRIKTGGRGSSFLWEIHDRGTSSYEITPRGTEPLTFYTAAGWRRSRGVRHPGVPSRRLVQWNRRDMTRWVRWAQQFAVAGITTDEKPERWRESGAA